MMFKLKYVFLNILMFASTISFSNEPSDSIRKELQKKLESQLDVRETKPNRGPMVDIYLKSVKSTPGNPWCAAFVGYNLTYFNIKNPNSAWSPSYANQKDLIYSKNNKASKQDFLTGDVVTFYYPNLKRVGHVGFFIGYDKTSNDILITIEGNTNGAGSREGDGVYKKKRNIEKIHGVSRYIK